MKHGDRAETLSPFCFFCACKILRGMVKYLCRNLVKIVVAEKTPFSDFTTVLPMVTAKLCGTMRTGEKLCDCGKTLVFTRFYEKLCGVMRRYAMYWENPHDEAVRLKLKDYD